MVIIEISLITPCIFFLNVPVQTRSKLTESESSEDGNEYLGHGHTAIDNMICLM